MGQPCPGFYVDDLTDFFYGMGTGLSFFLQGGNLRLGVTKACTQHDTARAGESCPPGWVLSQTLEESTHVAASHLTVTAELAVGSQGFPYHVGSRSLVWVRGGPTKGMH